MKHIGVNTLGDLARRFNCPVWAIRRVYERGLLPEPPRVRLETVLCHFDRTFHQAPALQLLDLLTLICEDLGAVRFAAITASRPWIKEFLR